MKKETVRLLLKQPAHKSDSSFYLKMLLDFTFVFSKHFRSECHLLCFYDFMAAFSPVPQIPGGH